MEKPLVLFVDDDRLLLDAVSRMLRNKPFAISTASSAELAMDFMKRNEVSVIVSDDSMGKTSGCDLLKWVSDWFPQTRRIMLTGQPNIPGMLRLINEVHLFRFLTKPVNDFDLTMTIFDALEDTGQSCRAQ